MRKIKFAIITSILLSFGYAEYDESNHLVETPIGFEFKEKSFNVGMSYRYLLNGENKLSMYVTPKIETKVIIPANQFQLTLSVLSLNLMLEPELSIIWDEEIKYGYGLEIDLFMMFSIFLFGRYTVEDGILKKIVEPYYQYENIYFQNTPKHEIGIRLGLVFPGLTTRK